jgi:hypothetical protein
LLLVTAWYGWPALMQRMSLSGSLLALAVSFGGAWFLIKILSVAQVASGF